MKTIYTLLILSLFLVKTALAAEFIDSTDDIPIAPGLIQKYGNDDVSFANDEARFVEVYLSGEKVKFNNISTFYIQTLPQMGWHFIYKNKNAIHFERDGEQLDIVRENESPLLIRITLKSKS